MYSEVPNRRACSLRFFRFSFHPACNFSCNRPCSFIPVCSSIRDFSVSKTKSEIFLTFQMLYIILVKYICTYIKSKIFWSVRKAIFDRWIMLCCHNRSLRFKKLNSSFCKKWLTDEIHTNFCKVLESRSHLRSSTYRRRASSHCSKHLASKQNLRESFHNFIYL